MHLGLRARIVAVLVCVSVLTLGVAAIVARIEEEPSKERELIERFRVHLSERMLTLDLANRRELHGQVLRITT